MIKTVCNKCRRLNLVNLNIQGAGKIQMPCLFCNKIMTFSFDKGCKHKFASNGLIKLCSPPLYGVQCLICNKTDNLTSKQFEKIRCYKCTDLNRNHSLELSNFCSICGKI